MAREFIPPETCPACGADERTGWDEDASRYDGLDLPDEAFTGAAESKRRRNASRRLWLVVGVALLVLLILGLILR